MVKIFQKGERIEYTQGDTFLIAISPEDGYFFPDGMSLEFIVAYEHSLQPNLEKMFELEDGVFYVSFSEEVPKLELGEYTYKMILRTEDGIIATQKSGEFVVIWGA
ncbi:MAG: hypothetical protein IJ300_00795 [Clostridia bacterium]|nr:hypothetical protein [Clostridia bacterium]